MDQQQVLTLFQTISGLLIFVVSILGVVSLTSLAGVIILIRALRNDKALMSALEKLYASAPIKTQETIKETGQALDAVSGFIGDLVTGADLPKIGG